MSGDAAMQAGAITADSRDGGSIWYNPAGLARMGGLRFDANMSAYALRLGNATALKGNDATVSQQNLSVLDFAVAPAGASFTKRLKHFTAGFGIFVPRMDVQGLRTHLKQPATSEHPDVDLSVDYHDTNQSLFGGPAFGVHLGRGVDLGMSFFVNYRSQLATSTSSITSTNADDETLLVVAHELVDWMQFGVSATLGVQFQLSQPLRAGINVRFPSLRVFQILDASSSTSAAVTDGAITQDIKYKETVNIPPRVLYPPSIHGSGSYQFTRARLALEMSYQAPFRNSEVDEDFRPLVNARLGYRHFLRPGVEMGGGIFTNRSANRKPQTLGDAQIDYYGLTLATSLSTPYEVNKRENKELNPKGHLVFGASFALSYALGLGQVMRAEIGFAGDEGAVYKQNPAHVIAHEWILSVGSSIFE